MAIAAHPDDIEFMMAGTLLLLAQAGYQTHYMTIANGSCGSLQHDVAATRSIRRKESERASKVLGAEYHPSLTDDLEILYELKTLRRLAAVVRSVNPSVLLVPSPQDYMEDHTNACRLAVSAAFARGMPNFKTTPSRRAVEGDVVLYHAMPHGLRDPLRRRIIPGAFVNTESVLDTKLRALAAHESQKTWLDASQGLDSYLHAMEEMSMAVGEMSGKFRHAEGWRRHLHFGFGEAEGDPLRDALGKNYLVNDEYERRLDNGPTVAA